MVHKKHKEEKMHMEHGMKKKDEKKKDMKKNKK